MGDAKRRGAFDERRQLAIAVTKRLMDEGKVIEGGWQGFRALVLAPDASETQVNEMRLAFYAGAQHLWGSIMTTLDKGDEASPRDLRRMDHIHAELAAFAKEVELRYGPAAGRA